MSVNNTCAISSSISFLISAAIWIYMEMPSQGYSQAGCRESSAKLAPREIAGRRKGVLPISIQSVYSFQIVVPVVQRIEQGFPKPKPAFSLESADIVTRAQTALSQFLKQFPVLSRVL